ncbi:fimbrial biogenesis chaperone [Pseudomonas chlororaphis]|uniref:fimbrial biogenesis chaperone n=1 Tax=Pseudomonas chlororaphis TaxID=587753 RepID=UPI000F70CD73|nr:molecular chaperone [Pseudomonas chlororaphis]AZD98974.1 Chaperone protein fimC precursor [Pseudomonas chlororaphis subsp. aureofaciens]WDG51124.1 molecular chaperone [Pseudomonas chlororaphis]
MKKSTNAFASIVLLLGLMVSTIAQAEISFGGFTRFIFDGRQKSLMVTLDNEGDAPALVQSLLHWGDKDQTRDLPMVVNKPLLLIPAHGKASLTIFYQGVGLPSDRESFFLLSVMQVPEKPRQENNIQIALQHNLKLIFRPKLPGSLEDALEKLHWAPSPKAPPGAYLARNDSPYYLTLTEVALRDRAGNSCGEAVEHLMIAPFSSYELQAPGCSKAAGQIAYKFISDSGIAHARQIDL